MPVCPLVQVLHNDHGAAGAPRLEFVKRATSPLHVHRQADSKAR
jgi:hypothetical protein